MRVLVLEDNILIGMDLEAMVEDLGHQVVGPFGTLRLALAAFEAAPPDFAILDFNLGSETSEPLADLMQAEGRRFCFLTGLNRMHLPIRFAQARILQKPISQDRLAELLAAEAGAIPASS